jgi:hypothetical protein
MQTWAEQKGDAVQLHSSNTGLQKATTCPAKLHSSAKGGNRHGAPFRILCSVYTPGRESVPLVIFLDILHFTFVTIRKSSEKA